MTDHDKAKDILKNISYYTLLNGYKNIFSAEKDSDNYADGTTFELIYYVYWLDINLSNIILKYILLVEKSLKAKISYQVGKSIGVTEQDYLYTKSHYSNRNNKRNTITSDLIKEFDDCHDDSPIKYYKEQKNHVPPWILVNEIMFGLVQQWYSILPDKLKKNIANDYFYDGLDYISQDVKLLFLPNALNTLRQFRNKAAHGTRIFNFKSTRDIPWKFHRNLGNKMVNKQEYYYNIGKNDLYSVLIIITTLITEKNALNFWISELSHFFATHEQQLILNKDIYQIFGLPKDFIERLKKLKSN